MLVVYQSPKHVPRGRYRAAARRWLSGREHLDRFRSPRALENLFAPLGAGVRPRYVHRTDQLGSASFAVTLDLIAPYFLMTASDKNKGSWAVFEALSQREIAALERENARLLLLLYTEAFFPRVSDVVLIHEELARWPIDPRRVFVVNANQRSEIGYRDACTAIGVDPALNIAPFDWFRFAASRAVGVPPAPADAPRAHKFLCFNGQTRHHRVCIVLFLLVRGLLDEGLVSFLNYGSKGPLTSDAIDKMIARFSLRDELAAAKDELIARTPLTLDRVERLQDDYFVSQDAALYASSYFSIVTDTSFVDDTMLFITEKVYKPMANLHPFVYVGNCGALAQLRRLGFETFAPYFDERYDDEPDHDHRMTMLCAEIERLARMSHAELHEMYRALQPRLAANFERLRAAAADYPRALQTAVFDRLGIEVVPGIAR